MRVVQALHWLKDTLISDRARILSRLTNVLTDPTHGSAIRQDLLDGFNVLPSWMQDVIRELPGCAPQATATKPPQAYRGVKRPTVDRRSAK